MIERMKRLFLAAAVTWFVGSMAIVAWLLTMRGDARPPSDDFATASPASPGAQAPVDEEHARLIYRYFPEKLSQHWEEMLVRDYFHDMEGGVFVDVGSSHHRVRSTTHYLDVALGWQGIAIDAIAELAEGYSQDRPGTTFVSAYVGEESDEDAEFFVVARNTRLSTGDEELAKRQAGLDGYEKRVIKTASLTDILDAHQVGRIDLLKMDIELAEPAALRGFDIDRFRPKLVVIEFHDVVREEIAAYMDAHGFVQLEKYMRWDPNGWFIPEEDLPAFRARTSEPG